MDWSILNTAGNLLFGSLPTSNMQPVMRSLINEAVIELRQRGHSVFPADIPGLWDVSGLGELTTNQVISIAFPAP